jgi:hypothetical protein
MELVALLRDVSNHGVMFYTNFPGSTAMPEVGTEVALRFQMPIADRNVRVLWSGKVVRLMRYSTGAATGIAMRVEQQEFTDTSH